MLADVVVRNGPFFGYSLGELAIGVVIVAAIIAVVWIALREFGVGVPRWAVQIFWVLLIAFVVILAIRLLLSM